jgi:hydroxylamine reductase
MIKQGEAHGLNTFHDNEDIRSVIEDHHLRLKGMAAYVDHAMILGRSNDDVMAFFHKALAATTNKELVLMDFVGLAWNAASKNLTVMGMLMPPTPTHTGTSGAVQGAVGSKPARASWSPVTT